MKSKLKRKVRRPSAPTTTTSTSTSTIGIPIKFSVNVIVPATPDRLARFLQAGADSPFRSLDEVPPILLPFIASSDEPDPEPDDLPPSLNYTVNTSYDIDSRGFRRSRVGREIVRLEQAAAEQEYWEQRLAESNEQEEAALKIVQEDHEIGVARDRALAEYAAKERDLSVEHAKRAIDEDQTHDDDNLMVSPSIEGEQRQ